MNELLEDNNDHIQLCLFQHSIAPASDLEDDNVTGEETTSEPTPPSYDTDYCTDIYL